MISIIIFGIILGILILVKLERTPHDSNNSLFEKSCEKEEEENELRNEKIKKSMQSMNLDTSDQAIKQRQERVLNALNEKEREMFLGLIEKRKNNEEEEKKEKAQEEKFEKIKNRIIDVAIFTATSLLIYSSINS